MKKLLWLTGMCAFIIVACKHEVVTPVSNNNSNNGGSGGTGGQQSSLVCFEGELLPFFKNTCASKIGCHNATDASKGYVFETYAGIVKGITPKNLSESKIYKMITEDDERKRMPKGGPRLSDTIIKRIGQWIMEGGLNTTNCTTNCDSSVATYAAVVKPIIDANCVTCHSGTSAPKGLDYTTFTSLNRVALDGRLIRAITHAPGIAAMPLGGQKLSDCNIGKIRKWVNDGAKNN